MRLATLVTYPLLLGAMIALPLRASAQLAPSPRPQPASATVDPRLGPEVVVTSYSPARQGDWRANASQWQLVTLYVVNYRYYRNQASGSRAVQMYSHDDVNFLPPEEHEWVGSDSRYNTDLLPTTFDYDRVRAIEHPGNEPRP